MTLNHANFNLDNFNNDNGKSSLERTESFDFSLCHGSNMYYDCCYGYWR